MREALRTVLHRHLALPSSAPKERPLGAAHHLRGLSQTPKEKGPTWHPQETPLEGEGVCPMSGRETTNPPPLLPALKVFRM